MDLQPVELALDKYVREKALLRSYARLRGAHSSESNQFDALAGLVKLQF
jgi:hypothetical protein